MGCLAIYRGAWKVNFDMCSGRWALPTRETPELENSFQKEQPKQISSYRWIQEANLPISALDLYTMGFKEGQPSAPKLNLPPPSKTLGVRLPGISIMKMSHTTKNSAPRRP